VSYHLGYFTVLPQRIDNSQSMGTYIIMITDRWLPSSDLWILYEILRNCPKLQNKNILRKSTDNVLTF